MTAEALTDRAVRLLVQARRDHRQVPVAAFGGDFATAEQAYDVQDRVAEALGWFANERPRAWKVGAPSVEATPIAVPLPPAGVVPSPARLSADAFHSIQVEAEIAFRFGAGVADAMQGRGDWTDWIDALVVTIEVVDSRVAEAGAAPALFKLADAQQHGALVVGDGVPRRSLDWTSVRARVRVNDRIVADRIGGHPLGDPTVLLPWFVNHVAARKRDLLPGDVVTAGTWAGMIPVHAGDAVEVEFDGVGRAAVTFERR